MYSEEKIKQIRIDLLTAADQVFNDYNRGLLAADRLQKNGIVIFLVLQLI